MFHNQLQIMIQNGSLNELNFQIRTQAPNIKRIFNESQQVISENDFNQNHEARSQNLHNRDTNFTLEHKKKLIKLMVMVKFERFGYQKNELLPIIQYYLDKMHDLDKVNNRHLSDQAGKVFLKVFSKLIGQSWLQFRRPNNRENFSEEERLDEMPQQQPNQRRVLDHESIIRIRPQQQNSILCNICYTVSNSYCDQTCGHSFCVECMKGYLQQNLRSDNYIVKCPEYECNELVSLSTVKEMLSPKQYQRFIFFRQKNEKQMNPENKFCSMPDCGEVLLGQKNRLICPKCKAEYCEICLQKYHDGQPCEVALGNELEHAFKHFQIKKCPGCKSPIQKSDGCNHMTCKKCKFEFCWLCQKKYSKHHYKYYNCFGCPGMQYQNEDEIIVQRSKQICLYMVLPIILAFLLFCYVAALPLFIIAKFIERPCYWSREGHDMAEYNAALKLCCQSQTILFYAVTWLFFQPRALLYALFVAPVKLTLFFCGQLGSVIE